MSFMTETLYRKYRPQTFADLIGQNHVRVTLQGELTADKVAHAYLFTGPRGVGKTTVARILAKSVNCLHLDKEGNPDNTCDACVDMQSGRSLDLIEIDAASHTGVENVRSQIIENARFSPTRWKYKVFIIDEVHMLSISAFNALLKTLEEPPAHALFILATTEVHKIPETILSRCQRFDFRRLRQEDLVDRLRFLVKKEKLKVDDDVLAEIARTASGSSRDAESLLGQITTLSDGGSITMEQAMLVLPRTDMRSVVQLFDALVRNDTTTGITVANTLVREGANMQRFFQSALEFFRKALLLKINNQLAMFTTLELSPEIEQQLLQQLENLTVGDIETMITVFLKYERNLATSYIPQLPLELAVVELTEGAIREPVIGTMPMPEPTPTINVDKVENEPSVPAAEKKSVPKAKKKADDAIALTLETVQRRWPEILTFLQSKNQSLRLTMNVAVPQALENDTLIIAVAYDFYRERIETPKHKKIIEEVFAEVFDQPITLRVTLDENLPKVPTFEREANVEPVEATQGQSTIGSTSGQSDPASEAAWNALVEAFGGK